MKSLLIYLCLFSICAHAQEGSFYGFNTANLFVHSDVQDTSFQRLFKQLEPSSLRFPGGHVGNFYHFNDVGYGYKTEEVKRHKGGFGKRIDRLQEKINKQNPSSNYVQNYLDLQKIHSFNTVLVVNILTESDEDILSLIAKINEGQGRIESIELGNELYNYAYRKIVPSVSEYIDRAIYVASLIREEYPGIPLLVCAAPTGEGKKFYNEWNEALSKEQFYDGYVVHLYPNVRAFEGDFERARDTLFTYSMNGLPSILEAYQSLFGKEKSMWITEWNLAVSQSFGNTSLQMLFACAFSLRLQELKGKYNIGGSVFHNLSEKEYVFSLINPVWNGEGYLVSDQKYISRATYNSMVLLKKIKEEVVLVSYEENEWMYFKNGKWSFMLNWSDNWISLSEMQTNRVKKVKSFGGNKLFSSSGISLRTRDGFSFLAEKHEPIRMYNVMDKVPSNGVMIIEVE